MKKITEYKYNRFYSAPRTPGAEAIKHLTPETKAVVKAAAEAWGRENVTHVAFVVLGPKDEWVEGVGVVLFAPDEDVWGGYDSEQFLVEGVHAKWTTNYGVIEVEIKVLDADKIRVQKMWWGRIEPPTGGHYEDPDEW